MKQILLFTIFTSICISSVFSEDSYSIEQGKVNQYELSMQQYVNDPDAEALVIYELGEYYFQGDYTNGGFNLYKNKKTKIKILTEAGLKYANIEIPIYIEGMNPESVDIIHAVVYNYEDGKVRKTELERKKVFEEKINHLWRVKKFTMPDVKPGSVIELEYTLNTSYFFNMGNWEFQKKIPVAYSRLIYRAVPYYEYSYLLKGANKFDQFSTEVLNGENHFRNLVYKQAEYTFGMQNLPAFRDEDFITSPSDYMIALNFQMSKFNNPSGGSRTIISTWPQMCDEFLKHPQFGKHIKKSEKEAKKILPEFNLTGLSQQEQLKQIVEYVKQTYSWNGRLDKYGTEKIADFLKNKTGDSGEINLFLIGLLKAAGIRAIPVVLSTRAHGAISKLHPFVDFFNYVIAQVEIDGEVYYIDGTEPLLYYTELPERCINVEGLAIKPKTEEWLLILDKGESAIEKTIQVSIHPDDQKLSVNSTYNASGHMAYNYRSIYAGKTDNLSKYLKKTHNIDTKEKIDIINEKETDKPFIFTFQFDTGIEGTSDKLFIAPFCFLSMEDNPFKQAQRTLPVDLIYQRNELYKSTIDIPEGYEVESLPNTAKVDNKLFYFTYATKVENKAIEIEAELKFKKNIYQANEYANLKNTTTLIIKKLTEMVVLVRR